MLEIQTNDIPQETAGPLCVLCEYAMMIVEKEILNNRYGGELAVSHSRSGPNTI